MRNDDRVREDHPKVDDPLQIVDAQRRFLVAGGACSETSVSPAKILEEGFAPQEPSVLGIGGRGSSGRDLHST